MQSLPRWCYVTNPYFFHFEAIIKSARKVSSDAGLENNGGPLTKEVPSVELEAE